MAIIETNEHKAEVSAVGKALDATVNFSGHLMEMLATTYVYILMASIREPIQNGCDAVKRVGLSFADGVMVHLPTPSNPMVTVVDKGTGMTKEFMEAPDGYLSFGSSTKAGDDGAAGGLGVGRWAAYGYIRECYITTCHASDMVSRTYFQFQGENGKPQVQLASEVPGTEVGTRVSFPVKESDVEESYRAVAWLKGVMQLTMGDSFSVDAPKLLPNCWPDSSGIVLDLETVDPGLRGVRAYPMKGAELKYNRQGLQSGCLVVLTNQERGIGGLPFHVQSPVSGKSVFSSGIVFEIPMSFRIPFMPSREEVKYTDEVNALLIRIGAATQAAGAKKAKELFDERTLTSKAKLTDFLGIKQNWHYFSVEAQTASHSSEDADFAAAIGKSPWTGSLTVPSVPATRVSDLTIKWVSKRYDTFKRVFSNRGLMTVTAGKFTAEVSFTTDRPMTLVVNDLPSGGESRFREWWPGNSTRNILYITSPVAMQALDAAKAINAEFDGAFEVIMTSSLPVRPRTVGSAKTVVRTSRVGMLTYHCFSKNKQDTESLAFDSVNPTKKPRIWLSKAGGTIGGFMAGSQLSDVLDGGFRGSSISAIMTAFNVNRLYLLTPKQVIELQAAQDVCIAEGLFDMADEEFDDLPDGDALRAQVTALKSWMPFEESVRRAVNFSSVQATLTGKKVREVTECWELNVFCETLAKSPRMILTGTAFDKAMSPYVDLLTGELKLHRTKDIDIPNQQLCRALANLSRHLAPSESDSDDRTEMLDSLKKLVGAGIVQYDHEWHALKKQFPLLHTIVKLNAICDDGVEHLCMALAKLYS